METNARKLHADTYAYYNIMLSPWWVFTFGYRISVRLTLTFHVWNSKLWFKCLKHLLNKIYINFIFLYFYLIFYVIHVVCHVFNLTLVLRFLISNRRY